MAEWRTAALAFIINLLEFGGLMIVALVVLAVTTHGILWAFRILLQAISHPRRGGRFGP
jgi:hypothetical protein